MKAEVITRFVDKNDELKQYEVGEIVEFEENRAKECESKKLVKIIEEKAKAKRTTKEIKRRGGKTPRFYGVKKCLEKLN